MIDEIATHIEGEPDIIPLNVTITDMSLKGQNEIIRRDEMENT